jgi:hypothetical protein
MVTSPKNKKIWSRRIELTCQALGDYWQSLLSGVPHLLVSVEGNRGRASMSRPTWPKDLGQEALNGGSLEDRYRIKSCK